MKKIKMNFKVFFKKGLFYGKKRVIKEILNYQIVISKFSLILSFYYFN